MRFSKIRKCLSNKRHDIIDPRAPNENLYHVVTQQYCDCSVFSGVYIAEGILELNWYNDNFWFLDKTLNWADSF